MKRIIYFLVMVLLVALVYRVSHTAVAVKRLNDVAVRYLNDGDPKNAISRLESAIDLDENVYETRYNLAVAYLSSNRCTDALKQITIASTLVEEEPAVYYIMGNANNCIANSIMLNFDDSGQSKKKAFTSKEQEMQAGKDCLKHLIAANEAYSKYIKYAPNSEESQTIMRHIFNNDHIIGEFKMRYQY